jgi:hypothetical protein
VVSAILRPKRERVRIVSTIATSVGLVATAVFAVMWFLDTLRHRSHLQQCGGDLRRQRRLDQRLAGCVADMERILDELPPSNSPHEVPEVLVGHVHYLNSLRVEASDNATRLGCHAVRLHWPDVYLSRLTVAGKRCQLAHGALITAFQTVADAAREYERGLAGALQGCGIGPEGRAPSMPVRLLNESAADEVARLREKCDVALAHTVAATRLRIEAFILLEATWPVRRSEAAALGADPYGGEIRPMGWRGCGGQPLLHVDAR